MVEVWGSVLTLIGNAFTVCIDFILFDAFATRKKGGRAYWGVIALGIAVSSVFSLLIDNNFGYEFKIVFEVLTYYIICTVLYESRWDRRLLIVVTLYAILYSSTYWTDTLCMAILHLTYEEYVWNVPLYSAMFLIRPIVLLAIALIIRKYHQPLAVGKQTRLGAADRCVSGGHAAGDLAGVYPPRPAADLANLPADSGCGRCGGAAAA